MSIQIEDLTVRPLTQVIGHDAADLVGRQSLAAVVQGTQYIRRAKSRLMRVRRDAVQFHVAVAGDSWTDNYGPHDYLRERFDQDFGIAAPGYVRFTGNWPASDVAVTPSGTWTEVNNTVLSPNISGYQSSTATSKYTVTYSGVNNATAVDLYALKSGEVRYRWNAGSWTTIDLSVASNFWAALASVPTGGWTLEVEVVSGTVTLSGVDIKTAAPGVVLHAIGNGNQRISHILALTEASYESIIARLGLHAIVGFWGTNDRGVTGMTPAIFAANYGTLIDWWRTAIPQVDIVASTSPLNTGNKAATTPASLVAMQQAAQATVMTKAAAWMDAQVLFGAIADYEYGGVRQLLGSADHPDEEGQAIMAAAMYAALTEFSF